MKLLLISEINPLFKFAFDDFEQLILFFHSQTVDILRFMIDQNNVIHFHLFDVYACRTQEGNVKSASVCKMFNCQVHYNFNNRHITFDPELPF